MLGWAWKQRTLLHIEPGAMPEVLHALGCDDVVVDALDLLHSLNHKPLQPALHEAGLPDPATEQRLPQVVGSARHLGESASERCELGWRQYYLAVGRILSQLA